LGLGLGFGFGFLGGPTNLKTMAISIDKSYQPN